MRIRVLAAILTAVAAAALWTGCGKSDSKPVRQEKIEKVTYSLPSSGKLGEDHLKLLTQKDMAEVLGRDVELQCEEEFENDGMSGATRLLHADSIFELATYRVDRVKDVEADAKEELRKAKAAGYTTYEVTGVGCQAFCYEIRNVSGRPKVVCFWNRPQSLRVTLTACEMTVQKAAELAGKIDKKLPQEPAAKPAGKAAPAAQPPSRPARGTLNPPR